MTVAAIAYAVMGVLLFVGVAQVVMVLQDRRQRRRRAMLLRVTTPTGRTELAAARPPACSAREDLFRAMCKAHDLTHVYADDHRAWKRGADQLVALREAAAHLPRETAMRIWNEEVDRKLLPGAREDFYWTGP